jgi:cell division protein FtsB
MVTINERSRLLEEIARLRTENEKLKAKVTMLERKLESKTWLYEQAQMKLAEEVKDE